MRLSLTYLDLLAVFFVVAVGAYFAVATESLIKSMKRKRAIEEFFDYMNVKMKTEEDFNEIVERLRRETE
jgi:activator of 2-hydroxyglutaryl-CoA dehydratase